jgi:hypothetical protein
LITGRKLRADLSNLSNGVLYYPILITFAWLTYDSVFSTSRDKDLQVVSPLLALFVGSLASIATERQDRVADRIILEMGGYVSRLKVRMLSLFIVNTILVSLGLTAAFIQHRHLGASGTRTIATALTVILIISTLGVLVASYMPHPLVSIVLTFFLMSWGGSNPESNWGLSHLLSMLKAESLSVFLGAALGFTTPWMIGSAGLITFSRLAPFLRSIRRPIKRLDIQGEKATPWWLNATRFFAKTAFFAGFTNALPFVALVVSLGLYSYGTLRLAADLSAISIGSNIFPALPGLLFANIVPALLLSGTSQRRESVDQESLLYRSQIAANTSQIFQQVSFVIATLAAFILALAKITNVDLGSSMVTRSIIWALLLSPGFATIGVYLNRLIRLPIISGLVSYLMTLPEILLASWIPESRPFLPSSLFSILVGGDSGYSMKVDPTAIVAAYSLAAILLLLPFGPFYVEIRKRRKTQADIRG